MMCRHSLRFISATMLYLSSYGLLQAQDRSILAVMDIQDSSGKLKSSDVRTATDFLRGLLLKSDRFEVVDKSRQEEKRKAVIEDLRLESGDGCYDEKCRVRLGRELAADTALVCAIGAMGSTCTLICELIPLEKGTADASGIAEFVCGADGLVGALRSVAAQLTGQSGSGSRAVSVTEGRIGETAEAWSPAATQRAVVSFASEPEGAVVLVDGKLTCQSTPCSETIAVGRRAVSMQAKNYISREEDVSVDRGTRVTWQLKPDFGWVTVESAPQGLDVKVDGVVVGKTPLSKHRVSPGGHDVLVTSQCHYDSGERVEVDRGKERLVNVKLAPRQGAIDVTARDASGGAVEADVFVDGDDLGRAPGVYRVSICAKEVEVRTKSGTWKDVLSVREKETIVLEAVTAKEGRKSGTCEFDSDCAAEDLCDPVKRFCVLRPMSLVDLETSNLSNNVQEMQEKMSGLRQSQIKKMEELLATQPYYENKAEVYFRLGEAYWQERHYKFLLARKVWLETLVAFHEGVLKERPVEPLEDNNVALNYYRKVLQQFPLYPRIDEVFYYLGRGALEAGRCNKDVQLQREGVKHFTYLLQNYPDSKLIPQSLLHLGDYYFDTHSFYYAKVNYEKIIKNYPAATMYNYALYKLGWVYYSLTETEKALNTVREVLRQGTSSRQAGRDELTHHALLLAALIVVEDSNVVETAQGLFVNVDSLWSPREYLEYVVRLLKMCGKDKEAERLL